MASLILLQVFSVLQKWILVKASATLLFTACGGVQRPSPLLTGSEALGRFAEPSTGQNTSHPTSLPFLLPGPWRNADLPATWSPSFHTRRNPSERCDLDLIQSFRYLFPIPFPSRASCICQAQSRRITVLLATACHHHLLPPPWEWGWGQASGTGSRGT